MGYLSVGQLSVGHSLVGISPMGYFLVVLYYREIDYSLLGEDMNRINKNGRRWFSKIFGSWT